MGDREKGYDTLLRPLYQLSQEEIDEGDYTIDYTSTLTGRFVKISQKTTMNELIVRKYKLKEPYGIAGIGVSKRRYAKYKLRAREKNNLRVNRLMITMTHSRCNTGHLNPVLYYFSVTLYKKAYKIAVANSVEAI